nr:hypothetical protein [Coxiella burnetii]
MMPSIVPVFRFAHTGYYTFNRTLLLPRSSRVLLELQTDLTQTVVSIPLFFGN